MGLNLQVTYSETSGTIEIGVVSRGLNWTFDIVLYQTNIDNRISRVTLNTKYIAFENISDSQIQGLKTSFDFSLRESILVVFNYNYIDAQNKTDKKRLSDIPEEFASLSLSYFPNDDIEFKTIAKYTGKQITVEGEKLGGFTIVNLKVNIIDVYENLNILQVWITYFQKKG